MAPPLLHIGYHKTGTNWLQEELFGNPRTGYRWLGKQPLTHPVHTLVRARPLDFDAAAVRAEFEPLLADAALHDPERQVVDRPARQPVVAAAPSHGCGS